MSVVHGDITVCQFLTGFGVFLLHHAPKVRSCLESVVQKVKLEMSANYNYSELKQRTNTKAALNEFSQHKAIESNFRI